MSNHQRKQQLWSRKRDKWSVVCLLAAVFGSVVFIARFRASVPTTNPSLRNSVLVDDHRQLPSQIVSNDTNDTNANPFGPAIAGILPRALLSESERVLMNLAYLADEKEWPYVFDAKWGGMFEHLRKLNSGKEEPLSLLSAAKFYNSIAVFPSFDKIIKLLSDQRLIKQMGDKFALFSSNIKSYASQNAKFSNFRLHGMLGVDSTGAPLWAPKDTPLPLTSNNVNSTKLLESGGGFYLELSDSLSLDRDPPDVRHQSCKQIKYDYEALDDTSIIITFYNEPASTLLRTVHSVLNRTPPPLLREIILVDDHSNTSFTINELPKYISSLPKVKLMRLPQRMGIVHGRLAGAHAARGRILVILDSHVEVNDGWLEPQLQRLAESPESIVFPQIDSIQSTTFVHTTASGIGCWLKFKWSMQERPTLTNHLSDPSPVASPSMAGGLFAVRRDWFFELGGYDEHFTMWGAENVEMAFRVWMCGGRVECTPCSHVFHIYRKGGSGYTSPEGSLWKNRYRTARAWMDDFFGLSNAFIGSRQGDVGDFDQILDIKKRLGCDRRNFTWFMDALIPVGGGVRSMKELIAVSDVRNKGFRDHCLDTMGGKDAGSKLGVFWCHNMMGTQGYAISGSGVIRSVSNEHLCVDKSLSFAECGKTQRNAEAKLEWWSYNFDDKSLRWCHQGQEANCECLGLDPKKVLTLGSCDTADLNYRWEIQKWEAQVVPPLEYSPDRLARMKRINDRLNGLERNYTYYKEGMAPSDD